MMGPLLKLQNVCKSFGGVVTADKVCMEVFAGEVHGLIGPNGAGKTTMLNLISGIYRVDSGQIYIDGKEITKIPPHNRTRMGLARTFQSPRFLKRSNIRDNLLLATDLANGFGYTKSFFGKKGLDLEQEMARLMEVAGFTVDLDEDISSLPYGRQKLLEIVRSMLTRPRIMLVDEPAAGLNKKEIEHAMTLLRIAASEYNVGVVLIEHVMDMIMNICHEITVLNFGRVIGEGSPDAVSKNQAVIEAYLGGKK